MANYYVPLAQQTPGQGINLEPINAALDSIQQQNSQNRAYAFQQKQFDATQQQRQFENARATKQDENAEIKMFGDRAKAFSQLAPDDPVRQNWGKLVQARHPNAANLDPRYLDPIEGPKLVMAEAGEYLDPRDSQAKDLALQETRAKINKLNVEAQNGGEAYGKTGAIFLNPETGRYEAVQFGGRGQVKRTELGGLTPSKGVSTVGDLLIDNATGGTVRNVGANLANAASMKEQGEAEGKAIADLPRQIDNAQLALDTINSIRTHPGKAAGTGAIGGMLPGIPGTQQRGFVNLVDQAKGQVFLQAFNSLRGGGQITEAEGSKATQALARIDRAQTQADFDKALDDYAAIVQNGLSRARTQATRTPTVPGSPSTPPSAASPTDWRSTFKRVD